MLRRKLVGSGPADSNDRQSRISARNQILLSRQEKRALRSLRLLEKVESIGLDNIMPSSGQRGISPLAMQSSPAFTGVRSRTASPMAQLTSLKTGGRYGGSSDDERQSALENRTAIRSALMQGGMSSDSLHSLSLAGSDSECSTTSSVDREPAQRRPTSFGSGPSNRVDPAKSSDTAATATRTTTNDKPTADVRLKQMQRQKSRRGLVNGQRPDLGTVTGKMRPDLGRVAGGSSGQPTASGRGVRQQSSTDDNKPAPITQQQQTMTQSFVGTISSLFFGRKGGLL